MARLYVSQKFATAIDKAVNQNKSISEKPSQFNSSLKVLKKIGKAYNHSLPIGFKWLWLKHNVDLLTPYQVKFFNRKRGTSAWERKGSAEMTDIKENKMNEYGQRGTCWVGYKQVGMKSKNGKMVPNCVKEEVELYYEENGKGYGYTFEFITDKSLQEAEYQGRKVKLNKIMQGDQKKFKVYVKNPKGNVVKVNFGQGGDAKGGTMRIRKSNPGARKSFRARHNCDNPGPKHKARYWACRTW